MAHDRARGDRFPMTQELLANMLCVYRPGVTITAHALRPSGLIADLNGRIMVLDRPGLEAVSCECHAVVRREIDRLTDAPAA